jgi:integrase
MKLGNRGGVWFIEFRGPDGRRLRRTTRERDKLTAEVKATAIMARAFSQVHQGQKGGLAPVNGKVYLGALLTHVEKTHWSKQKSARWAHIVIGRLQASTLVDMPISDLSYGMLAGFCDELRSRGIAPSTCNRYMSIVSRALREAERLGWLPKAPRVPKFKERALVERYLTVDEENRLLHAIAQRCSGHKPEYQWLYALVQLLLDTGCRVSEALNITAAQVRSGNLVLRHGETKSDRGRSIPLTPRATAAVIIMLASPVHGKMSLDATITRFRRVCNDAGLDGVHLHILRHTCASRLVQAGVSIYDVSKWLGHSSVSVTERYAHLHETSLDGAMMALVNRTPQSDREKKLETQLAGVQQLIGGTVGTVPLAQGTVAGTPGTSKAKNARKSLKGR